jgi:hypothetical protein
MKKYEAAVHMSSLFFNSHALARLCLWIMKGCKHLCFFLKYR